MYVGAITPLLREVAASRGELKYDILGFQGNATTANPSVISYNSGTTQKVTLHNEYDYFVVQMRAAMTGATLTDANADDVDELRYNIKVDGVGDLFTSDIELATMVTPTTWQPIPMDFSPGGYAIAAGKSLTFTLIVRDAPLSLARAVSVSLGCVLVPVGYHQLAR